MPNTQYRNYRLPEDSDVDWRDVVGDLARDVDADVASVVAGGAGGSGVPGGLITTTNVPANKTAWTDTGVVFTGEDALMLEASGTIAHDGTTTPYGPLHSGGAYLVWALITDGSTPTGDVNGQFDYRTARTAYRRTGRLWLRIRDVGGSGDNVGSFDVKAHYFADAGQPVAPLSEIGAMRDALTALTIRVSALDGR